MPEPLADVRRHLGRQLAVTRVRAGLTQFDLAARLAYSRSSVANAETGRALPERTFWLRADRALGTGATFVTGYDAYRDQALTLTAERIRPPVPAPPGREVTGGYGTGEPELVWGGYLFGSVTIG